MYRGAVVCNFGIPSKHYIRQIQGAVVSQPCRFHYSKRATIFHIFANFRITSVLSDFINLGVFINFKLILINVQNLIF